MGYHRAGFEVVGVDLVPQPDYPFEFVQANALTFSLEGFDAVHASPPCQVFSDADLLNPATFSRLFNPHMDLIAPTRGRLLDAGVPYVIENVPPARSVLLNPFQLCGSSFSLEVVRHRLFEIGGWLVADVPPCKDCRGSIKAGRAISVFGHGGGRMDGRRGMRGRFDGMTVRASYQRALGIDHIQSVHQLAEAIPPAYTEFIGIQLLEAVK